MQSRAEQNKKLLEAAKYGDAAAIKAALAAGAELNARDEDENTPLMIAAEYGHVSAVNLLLDKGADASLENKYNTTALFKAARWEQPACLTVLVDYLIKKYNSSPEQLAKQLETDNTRLMLISFGKRHDIAAPIMELIDFLRANKISEQDISKLMPVDFVMPARPAAVAIKTAAAQQVKTTIKATESKPAEKTYNPAETEKLFAAARKNDLAGVKAAAVAGADINASSKQYAGNALHYASMYKFTNIMAELIQLGADINNRSQLDTKEKINGATPLIWATQTPGNKAAIELLLNAKAEVNAVRNDGVTALHFAAGSDEDACELLLKHGANAAVTDDRKCSPLHEAIQAAKHKSVKLLVDNLITTHTGRHIQLLEFLLRDNAFKNLIKNAKNREASLALLKLIDFLIANNTNHLEIKALLPNEYSFKNTKLKEDILAHLQSLPAAKRLKACQSILNDSTDPYRVILSMQRGSRPCKLGHGILKQVAQLESATALSIKNANTPDTNNDNATPLYTAAMYGNMAKVKQLIHDGADCSSIAYTGGILFGAAQSGDIDIINLLVENGANPNIAKQSVKHVFSRAFNTQDKYVKARLEAFFKRFPDNVITVTPADFAEIFGHTDAAGLLRILAGQVPAVAAEQTATLAASATRAQPVTQVAEVKAVATIIPVPVPALYPAVAPAAEQEPSALDAYMSARKNTTPTQEPAAAQKVALTEAVAAISAAVVKPVAVLQPTIVSTLSIFTPGKAIELVFDSPNPEINVPVMQPQKIRPSALTSSSTARNSLFSLDEPVAAPQPAFPAWMQELEMPTTVPAPVHTQKNTATTVKIAMKG